MINEYDLHAHTHCSDGALSPTELVQLAADTGIATLAITDHDTVAGIAEAKQHAQQVGVNLIAGVEVTSQWANMEIHVVGLCIDTTDSPLAERLAGQVARRYDRAEKICGKLAKMGLTDLYPALVECSQGKPPGRPDIARLLVAHGHCRTLNEAFRKYLAMGKSAFVKTDWPDLETAVTWIKEARGIPVLAHPGRYKLTRTKLSRLIASFQQAGGQALEVVSIGQDPTKTKQLAGFAEEYQLLASTGSDFHSPAMPWVQLGKAPPLPRHCRPVWTAFH